MKFILIQLIGVIAWLFLTLSYYRRTTNKILVFQILGTILYIIHYYLLGAYSGVFICIFEVVRDYSYFKTNKDKYIFMASIPIYIIYGIISFSKFIDILPIFSSLIDGYSLTEKRKYVVLGGAIEYTLWVIYDISVLSISGAITDGLIALSNYSILLFKKNYLKKLKIYKIIK